VEIWEFTNFVEIGGYAICTIGFGGWTLLITYNLKQDDNSINNMTVN